MIYFILRRVSYIYIYMLTYTYYYNIVIKLTKKTKPLTEKSKTYYKMLLLLMFINKR